MKTKNEINAGIAEFFRHLRLKRGLSKSKIADLLYMDDKTWARYESGQSSPTVSDFLWICDQLGEAPLTPVLQMIYPETYKGLTKDSGVLALREAAAHYFTAIASETTVREWDYICFGHHGSNIEPQIQEFCMIDHLPMEYRVLIARMVKSCWDIAVAKGELVGTDHIMPDVDIFDYGIQQGHNAAIAGLNSYSTAL